MSARSIARAQSIVAAVLVVAGSGLSARPVRAQSLADVARKEEERRKTVAEPAKVYTNKDLNAAPAGSTPPPPAAKPGDEPAKAADADPKAKADADKEPKGQAYWAGRLKALQDGVQRDQSYAEAMQTRINSLTADFANRDDPVQRDKIGRDRQKAIADLASLNKSVADGKKATADFLEEARRAGVPPGWLR